MSDKTETLLKEMADEMSGLIQILDAVQFSAGLGKGQIDRLMKAKGSVLVARAHLDALSAEGRAS